MPTSTVNLVCTTSVSEEEKDYYFRNSLYSSAYLTQEQYTLKAVKVKIWKSAEAIYIMPSSSFCFSSMVKLKNKTKQKLK